MARSVTQSFLTAEWRHLAMLSFEIDPAIVQPFVPPGTELDSWSGKTFVSVVAFLFLDTRVLHVPIPFHRNFEEVNLRFYVRRASEGGWKRGVVFVKEIVPRRAIAATARWLYNENYVACRMQSLVESPAREEPGRLLYSWWCDGKRHSIRVGYRGSPELPRGDSQQEFITEHYWGYVAQSNGSTLEYRVEHPQWRVWTASEVEMAPEVAAFYGPDFEPYLSATPTSAFVAEGSRVLVRRGARIGPLPEP